MATTTPRIGLTKPDGTDLVDIAVLNTNFDKIDSNIASTKIQSTKPTTANAGDLWWDSDTGTLYLYYVDANSSQWVAATSDPVNIGVVANQTERDAQYPTPAQGMSVYRTDLGVTQRYYGLYNVTTNPGGRGTAGWYNTEKNVGLIPMQPTGVIAVSGTASANSMGKVTFTGCSTVILLNCFTSAYSKYRIIVDVRTKAANGDSTLRMRLATADGTQESTTGSYSSGWTAWYWGATNILSDSLNNGFNLINNYYSLAQAQIELYSPNESAVTMGMWTSKGSNGAAGTSGHGAGEQTYSVPYPSIALYTTASTIGGTIQVFGYND